MQQEGDDSSSGGKSKSSANGAEGSSTSAANHSADLSDSDDQSDIDLEMSDDEESAAAHYTCHPADMAHLARHHLSWSDYSAHLS